MVESLGHGRYRVPGARGGIAFAAVEGARTWVFIDGRTFIVNADDRHGSPRESLADEQTALSAPMPATVVAVSAVPGQRVSAGDTVIMLEAMKMELPIKAPRDGRVAAIHCREGELVQPGVPLVELE